MKTPAPGFLGARALVDEEEVPGGQGGDGTPDCERPLSRETNASRPTERLRQPGEHHKVGMKRLGVLVALPPKRDSGRASVRAIANYCLPRVVFSTGASGSVNGDASEGRLELSSPRHMR